MAKLTFAEALERLNDQRSVSADEVQAAALRRPVWVYEWHLPGCLSDSMGIALTKREAIESALGMAAGADGAPRGMRTDLQRFGRSDRTAPDAYARGAVTTIQRKKLGELL